MDARQFNTEMDARLLSTGVVDKACFIQLAEAYGYGAASSVGWVEAKIQVLVARLSHGQSIGLHVPSLGSLSSCASIETLQVWVNQHFPGVSLASARCAT